MVKVLVREGEAAQLVANPSFLWPNELKSDNRHL